MNNLKRTREALGLKQDEAAEKIKALSGWMNRPALSNIESGAILPSKTGLRAICDVYGKEALELWSLDDLDLLDGYAHMTPQKPAGEKKNDGHRNTRKKTFRLDDETYTRLNGDVFRACGYLNGQDWFNACVKRLLAKYEKKKCPLGRE